jgi:PhnB protein
MASLNPYLSFNGNAETVFNFYKSVFGGEFQTVMKLKDVPPEAGGQATGPEAEMIMHIALPIGDSVLMAGDRPKQFGPGTQGDHYSISFTPDNKAQADKVFNGLAAGGKIGMPLADQFWGAYFGMVTDKYGVMWMVNLPKA